MKRVVLSMLAVAALAFTSCSDDNVTNEPTIQVPQTYAFERDGQSTVSFGGQTTRIKMANILGGALLENSRTKEQLDSLFGRKLTTHSYFNDLDLDASDKNIRSKVAASVDYFANNATERNQIFAAFDSYIEKQVSEVFPNWNTTAEKGVAGQIQEAGGGTIRYVNAKGLEYNQAFTKSLIGALMVDQMLNNYLSTVQLDGANNAIRKENDETILAQGKNYTTMEHKWDEAYGYLYGNTAKDDYLYKYLVRVEADEDFKGIADEILNAFKTGRAAIVAKNYQVRDQQIEIIKEAVSKIIAIRAVYYLAKGAGKLETNIGSAFHDLSEGYGFIQSLRFTQKATTKQPHLPVAEIQAFLNKLQEGDGFWTITAAELNEMAGRIASVYGFTIEQAL